MHRATPAHSSFRAYTAGGARSTVEKADDGHLMQEMAGGFMKNEARKAIEAPQNYGFTSVVADAEKDAMGKIQACAETFISFLGGNRSFPVAGNMDDRRHRLMGLDKGDSAMFRGKDDDSQIHMKKDGIYHSHSSKLRMQLVPKGSAKKGPPESKQGSGGSQGGAKAAANSFEAMTAHYFGPSTRADDSGGGSGGSGGGQQGGQENKPTGQKAVADAGKDSAQFVEVMDDTTTVSGKNVPLQIEKTTYIDINADRKVYLGGDKKKAMKFVMTTGGPSINTKARIG